MSLLDSLIRGSLRNRLLVVIFALALSIYGAAIAPQVPVDVLPDLTAPTVTVVCEAHSLAPQEVEALVTFPIETAVNGATRVRRVRSASAVGISLVWVEFEWGTDLYVARQIVSEKLQLVAAQLPPDIGPPTLAPISSVMGEILFLGLQSDRHSPVEVRDAAEWLIRKRMLALSGVAQVIPIGGSLKQFQVLADPHKLLGFHLSLDDVAAALKTSNQNTSGGFLVRGPHEQVIRGLGRLASAQDIEQTVIAVRNGVPIAIREVATVEVGPAFKRGEGSADAEPAVILGVLKQPGTNTLELTGRIEQALDGIQRTLPEGMRIQRNLFRQADFISVAIRNVTHALRDGAVLVAVILFLFLFSARTTIISLAALPVSLLVAILAIRATGMTLNTMSLGGLTIAIGELVDDAIIDVENVFRRLRENADREESERLSAVDVIFSASHEIRGSIVFATLIVMLAFLPLFFLSGVEGRLLAPLGFSYLVAIGASLVVALTLTPALCAYLLPKVALSSHEDGWLVRHLKRGYKPLLDAALRHPRGVVGASVVLLVAALAVVPTLGRSFLPDFNEGSLTISAVTLPGTSLAESDRLGRRIEKLLHEFPEVVSTARRTGRAELDEHAQEVSASEIDVRLDLQKGRSKSVLLAELRLRLSILPGVNITIGQPISHRIDHLLSGTRANVAVKIFGDDLAQLRSTAQAMQAVMQEIPGLVDIAIEQQVDLPQLHIAFDREKLAMYGVRSGELAEHIETALAGRKVTQLLDGQRTYDVLLRYPDTERASQAAIADTLIDTPQGIKVPLKTLATLRSDIGPNLIARESVQRRIVITANVAERDLRSVITDLKKRVEQSVRLPAGYYVSYGGQFESEQAATRTLLLLGGGVVVGIFLLLYLAFHSTRRALLVMVNLPFALIGGVIAVWLSGGVLNVASLVGFITLFGIATRNGIMMVSHYVHLLTVEKLSPFDAVSRGSQERLSPVLMTALCAGLALVPLVLAGASPGNELQAPMGVVILGGLLSSTALNMLVVPSLFLRYGGIVSSHTISKE